MARESPPVARQILRTASDADVVAEELLHVDAVVFSNDPLDTPADEL